MLPLAHAGIPLGVAWLSQVALARAKARAPAPAGAPVQPSGGEGGPPSPLPGGLRVDYRLLLLGSMLPDIIDKPLGMWLLGEVLSSGRVFAHTLLFTAILLAWGARRYAGHGGAGLLSLGAGSLAHLLLDQMWRFPRTLLWPAFGLAFDRSELGGWIGRMLLLLLTEPAVYVPEAIGALFLAAFFWTLLRRGRLGQFLRRGAVD